jgi:hypothetical protein
MMVHSLAEETDSAQLGGNDSEVCLNDCPIVLVRPSLLKSVNETTHLFCKSNTALIRC